MSVVLDEQTDTVVLEGLDFETPCAIEDSHPAQYMVSCRSCGVENVLCATHTSGYRDWIDELVDRGANVFCKRCLFTIRSFRDGFRVVPL